MVKSVYFPEQAFYLIFLPTAGTAYVFDTRRPLEDGSYRVTTWNDLDHTDFVYDKTSKALYITQANGIAEYGNFTDNGSPYTMSYFTNHFDLGYPNINKLLKKTAVTVIGSSSQSFNIKAGFDYLTSYFSFPFTIKDTPVSEYGIADYGANATVVAEYQAGVSLDRLNSSVSGSGSIFQLGVEAEIDGGSLSIQKLDVYGKLGRTI